jgi:hypothetical protein
MNHDSESALRRIRRIWRMSNWRQRGQLIQVWLLLPVCMLVLRLVGFRRLFQYLSRPPLGAAGAAPTPETLAAAHRLASLTNRVARRHPLRPTCLHRSLLLCWLLRRQGLQPTLHIGVRRGASAIEAHAWVELHGQVLNDAPDVGARFAPFSLEKLPSHMHMGR